MEMAKGNFLCSYLKSIKISFLKNREQGGKTGPIWRLVSEREGRK
jgi:hypothetical protein